MTDLDFAQLKEHFDLPALVEGDLGHSRGKSGGKWLLWLCPFHPDRATPSLAVTPATQTYYCFGCGATGDALTWLREYRKLDWPEIRRMVGGDLPMAATQRPVVPRLAQEPQDGPPSAAWQEQARKVIAQGEAALWGPAGEKARAWLSGRGFQETTLRRWHIGYNPQDQKIAGLWVERGILIPWEIGGVVWAVNVRRPVTGEADGPKYKAIKGSKPGLYLADTLKAGNKPAVLAEGEFDALLLWQEAGDLVGVATLGSASKTLGDRWLPYLLPIPTLLVAYDTDQPGENGAGALTSLTARAKRIKPLEGKDITDFWKAGGNLRAWVSFHLAAVAHEVPPEPCTSTPETTRLLEQEVAASMEAFHAATERGDLQEAEAIDAATMERVERLTALYDEAEARPTAQTTEPVPALPERPSAAAMRVSWLVAGRAPGLFTSEGDVEALAKQLTIFAAGAPILALPAYTGSEDENGQGDYAN